MTSDLPTVLGNVIGPELLVVLGVVVLLFGGSQIPKLARSLGQAQKEFKAGQDEKGEKGPSGSSTGEDSPPKANS